MKLLIVFLAPLVTGIASASSKGEIESFSNADKTVCLEVRDNRFGLRIVTEERTHEVLGNGDFQVQGNLLFMEYSDSFDNKVRGTFDPKSGVLDLDAVKADIWTPSATLASYGRYVLKRKKCTSNVLVQPGK